MDITEILPLIIFGLIYLFGSAAKKKAEQAKKSSGAQVPQQQTEPEKKQSLQARLEEALREMQGQVEPAQTVRAQTNLESSRTQGENEVTRTTANTLYDRDFYSSESRTSESLQESTEKEGFEFHSLMEEVPQETYHGHGFTGFNQGHGLHAVGEKKTTFDDIGRGLNDFHAAHGLHYNKSVVPEKRKTGISMEIEQESQSSTFHNMADLRRAIILAEILAKPKALR